MKREISESDVTAYLETLLWSETLHESVTIEGEEYEEGTSLSDVPGCDVSNLETLAPKVVEEARADLEGFRDYCLENLGLDPFRFFDPSQVAHDFALSRNGHGAGFFDRSYKVSTTGPGAGPCDSDLSDDLQAAAETFDAFGVFGLFVWVENDVLHMERHT